MNSEYTQQQETAEQKKERYREELQKFFIEMEENGLVPEAMFQHGKEYEVAPEGTDVELNRPFGVFRVASLEQKIIGSHERAVYKSEINSEQGHGIDREIAFYKSFLPKIKENLSGDVRDEIAFPELLQVFEKDGKPKAILMTELQGKIMGEHDFMHEDVADETDFRRIIELIKAVQKLDPFELQELSPSTTTQDDAEREQKKLDEKIEFIVEYTSEEHGTRAQALLEESRAYLEQQDEKVLSEDVFQTNLMVLPDGRTASFDWERLKVGKNPGHDYSKFASRMWTDPEKMNQFIKMTRKANQDIEGFDIMFRSNLLAYEYSHFMRHYTNVLRKHEADPEKYKDRPEVVEQAKRAVPVFAEAARELIDQTGPWSDEEK